jgi:DNA mismatch repair protein MutS2
MDPKSIRTLELPLVLAHLAELTAFSAGRARALESTPSSDFETVSLWQRQTTEARRLLATRGNVSVGGARDVREAATAAARGMTLRPEDVLAIRQTVVAGRTLGRLIRRAEGEYPALMGVASGLHELPELVEAIDRTLDDDGEIRDNASQQLSAIRIELRRAHDRLLGRLQRVLSEHASHLQEQIITQREGRYVVPLRAEFKGRLRGIVHDQSSSGATLFIEPLVTVELNNRWKEQQLLEHEEIQRILAALSSIIGAACDHLHATVAALAELDLILARARFADSIGACEPVLVAAGPAARLTHNENGNSAAGGAADLAPGTLQLITARHPLLEPSRVVPIDLEFRPGVGAIVITGPNTGGKTVALKTAGLLALMSQCGLHIPAASGSSLAVFDNVFADIGDEQSIQQSLSTFSAHITQVIRILEQATPHSLVILDELGAGTDPTEGSALARAILIRLISSGVPALVATHYPELKAFAHATPGVMNASVEFDPRTLQPTYRIALGVPGQSNALAIAARLGLDQQILDEARTMISPEDLAAGQLLQQIQRDREAVRTERAQAAAARREASETESKLSRRLARIEDERQALIEAARDEAQREVQALREELRALRRRAHDALTPGGADALREAEGEAKAIDARLEARAPAAPVGRSAARRPRVGDTVHLRSVGVPGKVVAVSGDSLEMMVGALRVRADVNDVAIREASAPPASVPARPPPAPSPAPERRTPGMELDLRGMTVDEALVDLDRYLDSAFLAHLPFVRIIHGKGTGRLRVAIREALRAHSLVAGLQEAGEAEGGEGVTIARLAS